jgi:glycosyltransferase involved in cell wall biosynthesis
MAQDSARPLRLVAVIEASTVTGPAKNLIRFCAGSKPALEPLLITFVRGAAQSNLFLDAVRSAGLNAEAVPESFRFDPRAMMDLTRRIHAFQPDLLQTHGVKSHFLVRLSRLHRRYPWLAFHHGYTTEDRKMEWYNRLNRWSLPAARRVVTVCGPFAEQMKADGVEPDRIEILHNSVRIPEAVAPADVQALRSRLGIQPEDRVILTIGRFSKEKAQSDLLDAFARLSQGPSQSDDLRLVLVGDGPERENLTRQAEALGISSAIVFAGQVSNVNPFYAMARLFVLPSRSEGSPNVLLEALAAGVPIVATAVGGVPEVITHESNGLLVQSSSAEELAEGMERALSQPSLAKQWTESGLARIEKEFTPEAYRARLFEIYRQVRGR